MIDLSVNEMKVYAVLRKKQREDFTV